MSLVINATELTPGGGTAVSGAHDNTGGAELIAFVANPSAGGAPSLVQYAGSNMTSVEAQAVSTNVRVHIYKLAAAMAGSNTFVAQWPGATTGHAVVANWPDSKGILQSTGGTQTTGTSGSLSTASNTKSTSKVYMVFAGENLDTFSETSGATLIHEADSGTNRARLYEKSGTGGVVTFTWEIALSARDMAFALCEIGHADVANQAIWWM